MKITYQKIKSRLWSMAVHRLRETGLYPYLYRSYWHYRIFGKSRSADRSGLYFAARPNPGAGIGHQMANWIAGFWWAKQFGLRFAHIPFSDNDWDRFLNFNAGEKSASELVRNGYKKLRLPLFKENVSGQKEWIENIIDSHSGRRILFICEQDQSYKQQYGVMSDIQRKFYSAPARKKERLIYSKAEFNVAVHIRRGDIAAGQVNHNPNLMMRWLDNGYFIKVLENAMEIFPKDRPVAIYIFSQGKKEDFEEFERFKNVKYCLDMNARDSFLHFVYADCLITSKSSFSYKPALLNRAGIKICPRDFWHDYPKQEDWILADATGRLEVEVNRKS